MSRYFDQNVYTTQKPIHRLYCLQIAKLTYFTYKLYILTILLPPDDGNKNKSNNQLRWVFLDLPDPNAPPIPHRFKYTYMSLSHCWHNIERLFLPLDELLRIICGCVRMLVRGDRDLAVGSVCSAITGLTVWTVSWVLARPLCRSDSKQAPIRAPFGSVPYRLIALRTFCTSKAAT